MGAARLKVRGLCVPHGAGTAVAAVHPLPKGAQGLLLAALTQGQLSSADGEGLLGEKRRHFSSRGMQKRFDTA